MNYTPMTQPLLAVEAVGPMEPHSLYMQFQAVTEPPKKRGVRYSLALQTLILEAVRLNSSKTKQPSC